MNDDKPQDPATTSEPPVVAGETVTPAEPRPATGAPTPGAAEKKPMEEPAAPPATEEPEPPAGDDTGTPPAIPGA